MHDLGSEGQWARFSEQLFQQRWCSHSMAKPIAFQRPASMVGFASLYPPHTTYQLICPTGARPRTLSSLTRKNIFLFRNSDFQYVDRIPPRHEGRIAVVTKREAERGGREGAD
jgi:hypothetical protein